MVINSIIIVVLTVATISGLYLAKELKGKVFVIIANSIYDFNFNYNSSRWRMESVGKLIRMHRVHDNNIKQHKFSMMNT